MSALGELASMGEALGGLRWVQGPGGNVSVKTDRELWVKASGKRLVDVAKEGGHARVPLAAAARALDGDAAADGEVFAIAPRPSLEVYFHAIAPRIVAHTHALGALLYACSEGASDGSLEIPYVRPGRGVALAIRDVFGDRDEGLVVLRSHGIVAFAATAARAIELTRAYDDRVRARFGPLSGLGPDIEPLVASYLASEPFAFEGGHARAIPRRKPLEIDPPRYLFPDAPVCASVLFVDRLVDPPSVARAALEATGRACLVVDAAGERLCVAKSLEQLRQSCEVAAAHDWLEDALRAKGTARYLADDEPAKIVNMPSEQYRIQLKV